MQISAKARLISIIIALVFMFGALAGTGAYLIVNHINKANATTETTLSVSGNLYNTNGTINTSAVTDFLNKLDFVTDGAEYKSPDIADRAGVTATNSFIFQMGYYVSPSGAMDTSKPITWQAVYARNGYLTIWMTQNYTVSDYNDSGDDVSTSSPFSDYSGNAPYSNNSNYSKSVLRDVTNNIYDLIAAKLNNFSTIVRSPNEANATWQATQTEDVYTYSSSYYDHHNGLKSYSGKYTGWSNSNWDSANPPYNDKFWIPSSVEVLNQTSGGSAQVNNGLWGLSATDRAFSTTRLDTSTVSNCRLRSGNSFNYNYAMRVNSSGSAYDGSGSVYGSSGVRPAAHLSISALEEALPSYSISVNSNNTAYGTVLGGGTYNLGETVILTATPNAGYQLKGWSLDGGSTIIAGSEGKTDYQITVTADATYTAVFLLPIYLNITGNSGTYTSKIDYNSETKNATIIIHPDSNDYINTIWLDSNTPQIVNKWSDYIYQDSAAFNVSYEVTDFSNTIIVNIKLLEGEIAININFAQFPPVLEQGGGTSISGVALQVSASGGSTDLAAVGEARITGYNQTEGLTTVHVSAVASTGYRFVGWQVDGETISTLLSADISYSDVEGKILVAVFAPIDNNTQNSQTDNGYIDDFV